jgi:hypothetical protein
MIAAEAAMRAWVNARQTLVGPGCPLANGCFLSPPIHSPDTGAWALLTRIPAAAGQVVAEDSQITQARLQFDVYCGDEVAAEAAAAALAAEIETLTGCPEPAGESARVLVHDNLTGPAFVPQAGTAGEPYCFQVQADVLLAAA